jgi:uncharacterized membrane protein YgaE (UPF0421/DUF939 family)
MEYLTSFDIFNRENLVGDQSINTINNFNDYLDSLFNPFNDILTELILDINTIYIPPQFIYTTRLISNLQVKHNNLLNKYTLINNIDSITTSSDVYITDLDTIKTNFTTILNSKALFNSPLTRPNLTTVLTNNINSAINKQYTISRLNDYKLPTPIPNTKLYVNKDGTGYIWEA